MPRFYPYRSFVPNNHPPPTTHHPSPLPRHLISTPPIFSHQKPIHRSRPTTIPSIFYFLFLFLLLFLFVTSLLHVYSPLVSFSYVCLLACLLPLTRSLPNPFLPDLSFTGHSISRPKFDISRHTALRVIVNYRKRND